jgi:hypothetical protein
MADRLLFIGWGAPVHGREERSLEVFNQAVGMYGRMQQEGEIESFDVVMLDPNGGLDGYMELHGSAQQLAAVRMRDDFRQLLADAGLIVQGLRVFDGATNEGVAREVTRYQEAMSKVPQHT